MKPLAALALLAVGGCRLDVGVADGPSPTATTDGLAATSADSVLVEKLARYTTVRLTADLSGLSDSTRAAVPHLIAAARLMDGVFWQQATGASRDSVLSEPARRYAAVNGGPWDRLDGDAPFLPGVAARPPGAGFYPADLAADELLTAADLYPERGLTNPYTLVRRDDGGTLTGVPYHRAFADAHGRAAAHLRAAADVADDDALKRYLRLRADALLADRYRESDLAWLDLRASPLDVVIGPVETFEDGLAGVKAAHQALVLVRDPGWSDRLARVATLLPELRAGPPVADASEVSVADLGVYDLVFAAGEANVGAKAVGAHLPNDPAVVAEAGTRRLQLRNVARAKFEHVLAPIAELLLPADQRDLVTFPAFFGNAVLHEAAHGLDVADGGALGDRAAALEEAAADAVGLLVARELVERGEWDDATLAEHHVTFVASVFRSVRFGASGPRGRASLIRFNVLQELGAVVPEGGPDGPVWRVALDRMPAAVDSLVARISTIQVVGDYGAADAFVRRYGRTTPDLAASLDRVADADIPVDVVYQQGEAVLGLEPVGPLPATVADSAR